jgi:hypothetical protein
MLVLRKEEQTSGSVLPEISWQIDELFITCSPASYYCAQYCQKSHGRWMSCSSLVTHPSTTVPIKNKDSHLSWHITAMTLIQNIKTILFMIIVLCTLEWLPQGNNGSEMVSFLHFKVALCVELNKQN